MKVSVFALPLALSPLLLVGCDVPPSLPENPSSLRETIACEEEAMDEAVASSVASLPDSLRACVDDEDCAVDVYVDVACDDINTRWSICGAAYAHEHEASYREALAESLEALCTGLPSLCLGGAECGEPQVGCGEGLCVKR